MESYRSSTNWRIMQSNETTTKEIIVTNNGNESIICCCFLLFRHLFKHIFFTFREFLIGTECFQTKVTTIQANKLSNNNKKWERSITRVQNLQLSFITKINCFGVFFIQ